MDEYRFIDREDMNNALVLRGKLEETETHYIIVFGVSRMKVKKEIWRLESSKPIEV